METNSESKHDQTGNKTSRRKITLGLRVDPDYKHKLSIEAENLGISLSERAENLLLRGESEMIQTEKARAEAIELKQQLQKMTEMYYDLEEKRKNTEARWLTEKIELNKSITIMESQIKIFRNARLLYLLGKLKGQKDRLEINEKESIEIVYHSPVDLLLAMIYSFKIKKT